MSRARAGVLSVVLSSALAGGCLYTRYQTDSARSATEQLLLTTSMDRAVARISLPEVAGLNVALELASLAPDEAAYLGASIRERLRTLGARLEFEGEPDLVLVGLVGAIGTASRDLAFGLPALPLPTGGASPAFPILRVLKQRGYTKLRVLARHSSGELVPAGGPVFERASFEVYSFLFLALRRNDIYPDEELELAID